jgi:cytidine deaminase
VSDQAKLIEVAKAALDRAYAPYSKFRVGAAVAAADGTIYSGSNVENASYGLSMCAERTAVLAAVLGGTREITGVAVCTEASPPSSPCGACRQVMSEFAKDPSAVKIVAINLTGDRREWTLAELLPDGFTGEELP